MKKKLTYEDWVTSFVENLSDYFNLSGWQIEIQHEDSEVPVGDDNFEYARIQVDSIYQTAHLTINKTGKDDYDQENYDRLTKCLVHELVHIFLDPFNKMQEPHLSDSTRPYFQTILEQQTQRLTMVFLKTLPESIIPPR